MIGKTHHRSNGLRVSKKSMRKCHIASLIILIDKASAIFTSDGRITCLYRGIARPEHVNRRRHGNWTIGRTNSPSENSLSEKVLKCKRPHHQISPLCSITCKDHLLSPRIGSEVIRTPIQLQKVMNQVSILNFFSVQILIF